jgi:uncharacterized protein (DUF1778 family)
MALDSVAASERLEARVTARQKALFKEAATLQGVTLTDFVVRSLQQAALRTLEERHLIELSRNDQKAFVRALLHPAAPNARLRDAWSRHHQPDVTSTIARKRAGTPRTRSRA